jgi:hypothetical protein
LRTSLRTSLGSSKVHNHIHKPVCKQCISLAYFCSATNQRLCSHTGLWIAVWTFELHNEVRNEVRNISLKLYEINLTVTLIRERIFLHARKKVSSNQMVRRWVNLFLRGNFEPGFRDDFVQPRSQGFSLQKGKSPGNEVGLCLFCLKVNTLFCRLLEISRLSEH